jgi:hypothetical protein
MDLANRVARCACGKEVASSADLAFFEFRGQDSREAALSCGVCRFHKIAHDRASERNEPHLVRARGHEFVSHGAFEFDHFYCGCRGWD